MKAIVNIEALLDPEEDARAKLCTAAIQGILEQYGCKILPAPFFTADGRIGVETHVVPKDFGNRRDLNGV